MKKNMKSLVVLFLAHICCSNVHGQKSESTKIDQNIFGVIAGGTLSNISNYDANHLIGFVGGLYWEWRFSEKLSTMPNILYSERGAEGLKLAYLSIPIVLKYNPNKKFSIATGIAWDDLIAVNGKGAGVSDYNLNDWRIPVTAGYNITTNLSIGSNYNFGLSDISGNDNRNNWWSFALAYKILEK